MDKLYRILKREGRDGQFESIGDTFTEQELQSIMAKLLRAAIVVNESHDGNPVLMVNLHHPDEPSIPDVKMYVTFEEIE